MDITDFVIHIYVTAVCVFLINEDCMLSIYIFVLGILYRSHNHYVRLWVQACCLIVNTNNLVISLYIAVTSRSTVSIKNK